MSPASTSTRDLNWLADRFLAGTYAGDYAAGQVAAFEATLAHTPPWLDAGEQPPPETRA